MSRSSLVKFDIPAYSGNYSKGRSGRKIEAITIHHMAGILSAKECGKLFQDINRKGSSHYGIGNDGEIAQYVDEQNTAWTNSNWDSNCKSITIETSNCLIGGNWKVSESALESLIKLVADIAQRNNLGVLIKGKNLTWHSMFCSTVCPGEYLISKMDYIIDKANEISNNSELNSLIIERKIGDVVSINCVYKSSTSTEKMFPLIKSGKITKILKGAINPYLLENGKIGWINEECIVQEKYAKLVDDVWCRINGYGFNKTKYKIIPKNTVVKVLTKDIGYSNNYSWDEIEFDSKIVYLPNAWSEYI